MKVPMCWLSLLSNTRNPNLSTPWGRYRHGCDTAGVPDSIENGFVPSSCRCLTRFSYSHTTFGFLSHLSLSYQNIRLIPSQFCDGTNHCQGSSREKEE